MIKTEQKFVTTKICSYKIRTLGGYKKMAQATVEGTFMGKNIKKSSYDGVEKTAIYIDLYQHDSQDTDKMVQLKTDDLTMLNTLEDYDMGSIFKAKVSVNAYKNKAYYKLQSII